MKKILIWDVPTRLFHWLLVASFVGAFVTAESERQRDLHVFFGITLALLIGFRLIWGIVGTRYARFRSFLFGPRAVLRSLRSLATLSPPRSLGHTPPGSWAIWLMLALGMAVAATGYLVERDGAEALEDAHAALAWTLLAVVGIHVAGVLLGSVLHRENLIMAMITGRKHGDPGDAIRRSHWLVGVALIALVAALWGGAIAVPGLAGISAPSAVAGHEAGRHDKDD